LPRRRADGSNESPNYDDGQCTMIEAAIRSNDRTAF
jgi:hypothetical protein